MKLLVQSAMIFFGTLMTAAVVALGEPAQADVSMDSTGAAYSAGAEDSVAVAFNKAGLGPR